MFRFLLSIRFRSRMLKYSLLHIVIYFTIGITGQSNGYSRLFYLFLFHNNVFERTLWQFMRYDDVTNANQPPSWIRLLKPLCPIFNNRFITLGRIRMWEEGGDFNSTIDIIQRFGISIYILCTVNLVTFDRVCFFFKTL